MPRRVCVLASTASSTSKNPRHQKKYKNAERITNSDKKEEKINLKNIQVQPPSLSSRFMRVYIQKTISFFIENLTAGLNQINIKNASEQSFSSFTKQFQSEHQLSLSNNEKSFFIFNQVILRLDQAESSLNQNNSKVEKKKK